MQLTFNPDAPTVVQDDNWSCSCASTAWALQSLGLHAPYPEVESAMLAAGLVSPALGLHDGSGAQLADWLHGTYGLRVERQWPGQWDALNAWIGNGPMLLGGSAWYHWTAGRGGDASGLLLANPAESWRGVGQHLEKAEWDILGPWACLFIPADQVISIAPPDDNVEDDLVNFYGWATGDAANELERLAYEIRGYAEAGRKAEALMAIDAGLLPLINTLRNGGEG